MEDYNFWKDFFDTYQSLSDWMKFAWLIVPSTFLLGLIALVQRSRQEYNRADQAINGELIYSIHRDEQSQLHIFRHAPELEHESPVILLDRPNSIRVEQQAPIDKP